MQQYHHFISNLQTMTANALPNTQEQRIHRKYTQGRTMAEVMGQLFQWVSVPLTPLLFLSPYCPLRGRGRTVNRLVIERRSYRKEEREKCWRTKIIGRICNTNLEPPAVGLEFSLKLNSNWRRTSWPPGSAWKEGSKNSESMGLHMIQNICVFPRSDATPLRGPCLVLHHSPDTVTKHSPWARYVLILGKKTDLISKKTSLLIAYITTVLI